MPRDKEMDRLINRFDKINGNQTYTQRDLQKYIISRMDDDREELHSRMDKISEKLDKVNIKLDNHVTHISQRITTIETCISNFKWFFGGILGLVITVLLYVVFG